MASPHRTEETEHLETVDEWIARVSRRPGVIHHHNPSPVPFTSPIRVNPGVNVLDLLDRDECDEEPAP